MFLTFFLNQKRLFHDYLKFKFCLVLSKKQKNIPMSTNDNRKCMEKVSIF